MYWLKKHAASARVIGVIALGGVMMTGCATQDYVNKQIATVNTRVDQVDARVTTVSQHADTATAEARSANQAAQSAASAAQAANSAAQSAATDARNANQRLDQVTGRVDALEKPATKKKPRG
jgi:outer membrane murein-binding lipoprotein Lpp